MKMITFTALIKMPTYNKPFKENLIYLKKYLFKLNIFYSFILNKSFIILHINYIFFIIKNNYIYLHI
jgi:hypothetical protein